MTFFENHGDGCSQDETAQLSTCDYFEIIDSLDLGRFHKKELSL